MNNASARSMWGDYLDSHLQYAFVPEPRIIAAGTDEADSEHQIKLILSGGKHAFSHSLLGLQLRKERLPRIGDFTVLTDWDGQARCILRTVAVRLTPFFSIRLSHAKLDGAASLESWKEEHWQRYTIELAPFGRVPRESMIVVCEVFEKVFDR